MRRRPSNGTHHLRNAVSNVVLRGSNTACFVFDSIFRFWGRVEVTQAFTPAPGRRALGGKLRTNYSFDGFARVLGSRLHRGRWTCTLGCRAQIRCLERPAFGDFVRRPTLPPLVMHLPYHDQRTLLLLSHRLRRLDMAPTVTTMTTTTSLLWMLARSPSTCLTSGLRNEARTPPSLEAEMVILSFRNWDF